MRGSERFDIEAKADSSSVTEKQLLAMLQNLLADRFRLHFHRESKEVSGYPLVVAKDGPKLKQPTGQGKASLNIGNAGNRSLLSQSRRPALKKAVCVLF